MMTTLTEAGNLIVVNGKHRFEGMTRRSAIDFQHFNGDHHRRDGGFLRGSIALLRGEPIGVRPAQAKGVLFRPKGSLLLFRLRKGREKFKGAEMARKFCTVGGPARVDSPTLRRMLTFMVAGRGLHGRAEPAKKTEIIIIFFF